LSFFESKVEAITLSRERICIPRLWFCYEARASMKSWLMLYYISKHSSAQNSQEQQKRVQRTSEKQQSYRSEFT